MTWIGGALVAILVFLAGLHLYWGFGGFWPGHDADSLRLRVAGTPRGPMYGLAACAAVAGALASAAAIVIARHSALMGGPAAWVIGAGYVVLILVFGLRGLAPYGTPIFEYARGAPFYELNRLFYAPLCLAIAAGFAINFPFRPPT